MASKKNGSSYSLGVRIFTIALCVLLCSGALVYLVQFLMSLF